MKRLSPWASPPRLPTGSDSLTSKAARQDGRKKSEASDRSGRSKKRLRGMMEEEREGERTSLVHKQRGGRRALAGPQGVCTGTCTAAARARDKQVSIQPPAVALGRGHRADG